MKIAKFCLGLSILSLIVTLFFLSISYANYSNIKEQSLKIKKQPVKFTLITEEENYILQLYTTKNNG